MGSCTLLRYAVSVSVGLVFLAGSGVEAQEPPPPSQAGLQNAEVEGPMFGPSPEDVRLLPRVPLADGWAARHGAPGAYEGAAGAVQPRGSVPLMAAGGVLLVAGAVIGGDAGTLVMVGGAGVLAWGVYLHF